MTTIELTRADRDTLDTLRARLPLPQVTYLAETGSRAPARRQWYNPRRATLSGAIVVHTAENRPDRIEPDSGAENVAAFIKTRPEPGSYHTISDGDSVVRVGGYDWEMYHEGTGGNRHSVGLSIATMADVWQTLAATDPDRARALLNWHAVASADAILAVRSSVGIDVPRRRITRAEYHNRVPGFCGHRDLDPTRRDDPGKYFPWESSLERTDYLLEADDMTRMDDGWPGPDEIRRDVETLYHINGRDTSDPAVAADIDAWVRDLVDKGTGQRPDATSAEQESPKPTYAYIDWALAER